MRSENRKDAPLTLSRVAGKVLKTSSNGSHDGSKCKILGDELESHVFINVLVLITSPRMIKYDATPFFFF